MKVIKASNAVKIADFKLRSGHANKIDIAYLSSVPNSLLVDNSPRIYLLVVDGEILKIGGSAQRGGIKGTMSFYVGAMQGSPGVPRFVIHLLIEEQLKRGGKVELYLIVSPKVTATIYGLSRKEEVEIASFKEMEDLCKAEYFDAEGKFPAWNFQENHTPYPEKFARLHNEYHANRLK